MINQLNLFFSVPRPLEHYNLGPMNYIEKSVGYFLAALTAWLAHMGPTQQTHARYSFWAAWNT